MENTSLYHRSYAIVDLDAIRGNIRAAKAILPAQMQFCAVLKADAYGHGASYVAKAVEDLVDFFGIATLEEGESLRKIGVQKPILDLGVVPKDAYAEMMAYHVMPSVFTVEQARDMEETARSLGVTAEVTLALDTGMGRIGIATEDKNGIAVAKHIATMRHLRVVGAFTHFASADEADKSFTRLQKERFTRFLKRLEEAGVTVPIRHCANSASIIEGIGTEFNAVRDGIAMYGYYPSHEVNRARLPLKPALSWKAKLSYVKTAPAGTTVSYGSDFVTEKETEIATIPVGYADGFPRALSGGASVLIHGRKCPILGRICMDQFMVDVSGLSCEVGDLVTILGRDGEEEVRLEDWENFGVFPYEALCNIGNRIPRIYIKDGKIAGSKDYFGESRKFFCL